MASNQDHAGSNPVEPIKGDNMMRDDEYIQILDKQIKLFPCLTPTNFRKFRDKVEQLRGEDDKNKRIR